MTSNQDSQIDPNVLIGKPGLKNIELRARKINREPMPVLPSVEKVLDANTIHQSPWAEGMRIEVRNTDGKVDRYFMKVGFVE